MDRTWTFNPAEGRRFVVCFTFLGWWVIQLGFHVDLKMMNLELHLPFCFIRLGLESRMINYQLMVN